MTKTLISTARGAFSTDAAMIAPCSVNASGRLRRPPQLDVAFCGIKFATSAGLSSMRKSPAIAPHLLVDAARLNAVERGEIAVQQHLVSARDQDAIPDRIER
jgi:hypothetical protein